MATNSVADRGTDIVALQQAIQTASCELNYERSSRQVDAVIRDEDVRKLKFQLVLLEDENDVLEEQLTQAEESADGMEGELGAALARQEELEGEVQTATNDLRSKLRESDAMRAELTACASVSTESTKLLKEKFALHTELSKLKPELEHLRAESAAHQEILSEKLALQRQLSTVQVELENSQRAAERAKSKAGKNSDQDAEREAQLDDLHKQLAEARHSLKEAKREVNSLQKDLDSEKRAVEQNGANETRESGVLEELVQKLRTELTLEKKERQKADKALDKERQTWEAEKSIRDDKLAQFRSKLRATKEDKLALEAEVQKLQEEVSKKTTMVDTARPLAKNPRKRAAAQMGPDATIGTPGDALPSKKGKRAAASMPGEKSTFSITPFLNKTGGAAHESDDDSELEDSMAQHASAKRSRVESEAESEAEVAPAAAATKPASKKALAPAPSKKQNANTSAPARKAKAAAKPSLELVAEEADENDEADEDANDAPADVEPETTVAVAAPVAAAPAPKLKPKVPAAKKAPRKSLAEFSTFDTGDDGKVVKKKRKLLGGGAGAGSLLGKTLFDDEDDAEAPKPKPIPGRGAFLAKGGSKLLKGAAGTQPAKKQAAGFGFSPLKKDKRAAKLAASVLA